MAHIPPLAHTPPERPSSPLPSQGRVQGSVHLFLGSDKIVNPDYSLVQPSTISSNEREQQQWQQFDRGIAKALETNAPHTEHTYESYPSQQEAFSEFDDRKRLRRFGNAMNQIDVQHQDSARQIEGSVDCSILGHPVTAVQKMSIIPNHNDARPRVILTETTYHPQTSQGEESPNRPSPRRSGFRSFLARIFRPSA
jgi:hypothetical protein